MTPATYEIHNRGQFAALLRHYRVQRAIRCYSRFNRFGRVIILTDETRVSFPYWTPTPDLNIHPGKAVS